jgi:hypothetical protein
VSKQQVQYPTHTKYFDFHYQKWNWKVIYAYYMVAWIDNLKKANLKCDGFFISKYHSGSCTEIFWGIVGIRCWKTSNCEYELFYQINGNVFFTIEPKGNKLRKIAKTFLLSSNFASFGLNLYTIFNFYALRVDYLRISD